MEPPRVTPSQRVRMCDVADKAGVSTTTVSLVLSGRGTSIPDVTHRRVRDAAAELGYRRNAVARGLRRSTSETIGFVSDIVATTPFAGGLIAGAQAAAWE